MKKVILNAFAVAAIATLSLSTVACGEKKAEGAIEETADSATSAIDSTVAAADSTVAATTDSAKATVDSTVSAVKDSVKAAK